MDAISGSVERVTFYNPENGYSVIRIRPERRRAAVPAHGINREGLLTIVGNLPELTPGEFVKLQGRFVNHPKHGYQFQAEICEQAMPATLAGIRRYLGSGLIKGIGPKMADRIVEHFGEDTLEVIDTQPQRLHEVADIGPKRARWIATAWDEQRQVKDIMLFLHAHGVSTNLGVKIYKTYGDQAMQIVQNDPYQLARDIYGVGFKTADKIAQALGLTADHPSRIEAGVIYALNQTSEDGHVFLPQPELESQAAELLGVEADLVRQAIERLARDERVRAAILPGGWSAHKRQSAGWLHPDSPGRLPSEEPGTGEERPAQVVQQPATAPEAQIDPRAAPRSGTTKRSAPADPIQPGIAEPPETYQTEPSEDLQAVYLPPFYYGEVGVSRRLQALAGAIPSRLSDIPPAFVSLPAGLSDEQRTAIKSALSYPVSVLTGGPGTGKTTCLQALIAAVESQHKSFALCAPTGRAAKRLSEATGRPASTIHRLLDYSPARGFLYNDENPLLVDLLVVDEASMIDLLLANSLVKALPHGAHLLLVGDVDQLPSVGAGDVLRDVIASGIAPVTRLTTIFRQAADSYIITNAHRINRGDFPEFSRTAPEESDFFLFPAEEAEKAADWVIEVVTERIPARFGMNALEDIQVLAPMYRGPAGVRALNDRLQQVLNPAEALKPQKTLYGQTFRPGDKVMQTQNDYDKEVFNGDIGQVQAINPLAHTLIAQFEGRPVEYDWSECDQITLAYCVSVHKSQGAEFPCVVLPVLTQHYLMLQRNLLYTAVTRAKNLCVLVGSRRAIQIAVKNNQVAERNTALAWRLREER